MIYQKTIHKPVRVEGIGLHTGKKAAIVFKPAPIDSGIYFVRRDIPGIPALKAESRNVRATNMATVLGGDLFAVSTVEHCMAAVSALKLDNLVIELEGPEIPIGDGSAWSFFAKLREAEVIEQSGLKKYLYVTQPIYFSQGDKHAYILPFHGLKMTCTIDFPHPKIGRQQIELDLNEFSFEKELAQARTFGFLKDVEALQAKGLALGGSLDNAVVLDDKTVLNPDGLRFNDEFVRHKAMDALGDLLMLGHSVLGHVVLYKAGHDVMHGFVEKFLSSPDHYRVIELAEPLSSAHLIDNLYLKPQFG